MTEFGHYLATHRKWIAGAAVAALAGGLTYAFGPDSVWVAVVVPLVAVGLGVNYTPNRRAKAK